MRVDMRAGTHAGSAAMSLDLDQRIALQKTVNTAREKEQRLINLRELLRDYNHADVIAALGMSDLLEIIGVTAQLDYIQTVGYGPKTPERQFVRERVIALANGFECLKD
jgi:hypothetical protein